MLKNLTSKRKTRNKQSGLCLALICLAFFNIQLTFAQKADITGTVADAKTGETLPGVSVMVEGTTSGSVTDIDGKFKISVPSPNAVLVISYVGYVNQKVSLQGQSQLKIELVGESKELDEVVVIGYGTARKRDITGTVTSIGNKELANIPVSSAAEALTGRLAGVQITTTDGAPDAEMIIRVRGGGSVTGSNTPLYIVDGFPMSSISNISVSEIQSVDVLKDASATAIYGAQGANGVVMITTKSAKGGKTTISYNNLFRTKQLKKELDVLSPYEYVSFNYEYAALRGKTSSDYSNFLQKFGIHGDLDLYKYQSGHDYQEDFFGAKQTSYEHNISITGGSEKTKFSFSGAYNRDNGLIQSNYYTRLNLNFKLQHEISKNLKFDLNARVTDTKAAGSGTSGGTYKIRSTDAITRGPVGGLSDFTVVDISSMTEDEYNDYLQSTMTLTELANQYWKRNLTKTYFLNSALNWDIIKGLTLREEIGINMNFNQLKNYYGATTSYAANNGSLPLIEWTKTEGKTFRQATTLNYTFKVARDHDLNLMLGQETVNIGSENNFIQAKYFSTTLSPEKAFANIGVSSGTNNLAVSSYVSPDDRLESYFGRFNYSYKGRYLAALTVRADGSSKFAKGHQWGVFPAASVGWRISDENFLKDQNILTNLKWRLSYGLVGNNNIKSSQYQLDYAISSVANNSTGKPYGMNSILNPYYMPTNSELPNPDLKWETTLKRNTGIDFGFFHERLTGTFDAYWDITKDLLITSPIVAAGYTSQTRNIGQTSNKGIELTLNGVILQGKGYSLGASFNIALNRNKVDKLADGINQQTYSSGWASTDMKGSDDFRVIVGQPVGLMYGFVTDGYYTTDDFDPDKSVNGTFVLKSGVPTPGSMLGGVIGIRPGTLKLKDLNGDGSIDTNNDRKVIGDATPKHTGGFGLNGTFHGFDFMVLFNWVYGNDVYNANKEASTQNYRNSYPNLLNIMNSGSRYTYINDAGDVVTDLATLKQMNEVGANKKKYWSPHSFGSAVMIPHSWAIEDGSFLRLQNVTLGYTLPKSITQKLGINQFRIFGTLNNVSVLTNYTGYDPEVGTAIRGSSYSQLTPGVDYSSYPKSFSYTFGLNVTF